MAPESIDADPTSLPRAFRGYDRRATEELFRRVAWDYAVLAGEHRKLKTATGAQAQAPAARPTTNASPSPTPPPRERRPSAAPRADFDEEAHRLLGAAQKAARELRESTRAECELALKKAKRRADEIEEEAVRAAVDARAVLDAAAALRLSLQDALRTLGGNGRVAVPPSTPPTPTHESRPKSG